MDETAGNLLLDPASVLVGVGALAGLIAARFWLQVSASAKTNGETIKGPLASQLGQAATFTAIALALASAGYLFGRFTGRF